MGTGLYIHIPFCLQRCIYCSFNSSIYEVRKAGRYMKALSAEVGLRKPPCPPETVYVGGGTPTTVTAPLLAALIEKAADAYDMPPGAETTVEANPGTLNGYDIERLVEAGVNRMSLGAQSFDDADLVLLGRVHSPSDTADSVRLLRSAGIENISVDLIYGLPGQDLESWMRTVHAALELGTGHVSLYCLSVDEGTPLHRKVSSGTLAQPSEELQAEMYAGSAELLEGAGLIRYEISNFALPGRECAHNINYWKSGDYIGLGAGAYSCMDGVRMENEPDVDKYSEKLLSGSAPACNSELLSEDDRVREFIMLSLRTSGGLSFEEYRARFGVDFTKTHGKGLEMLSGAGCLVSDEKGIRLTDKGIFTSNTVMSEFF